jgi:hypothetical protein
MTPTQLPEPFSSYPDALKALEEGDEAEQADAVEYFRDIYLTFQGSYHEAVVLASLPVLARLIDEDDALGEDDQAALADLLFAFGERLQSQHRSGAMVEALRRHFPMALDAPADFT